MGGLRAAVSGPLVAKSGDARLAQMTTKTNGKLRAVARSAAVAATHAGARALQRRPAPSSSWRCDPTDPTEEGALAGKPASDGE
eukprot:3974301-Pyramimonas_sp.AAC.1